VTRRVVVVGGGIAGLTAAYRLARRADAPDVVVLEADGRAGGKIASAEVGGLTLESGPDSMLARKPAAVEFARELGLGDDLVPAVTSTTHIWSERGLVAFPQGPFGIPADARDLWAWEGLSRRGRLRALGDLWRRAAPPAGDESLGSLLRRRLGDEATDALVAPLLGGLFAGDVDQLSVRATFPELAAWERDHASLIRGARAASGSAGARAEPRAPMFVRVGGGLERITQALVDALGHDRVRTRSAATAVSASARGAFVVSTPAEELDADAVVVATPATVAASLLWPLSPRAADELDRISYVSTAVVLLVYREGTGDALPESSGFVVPRGRLAMTACTLVSRKWPDRAFGSRAVVRCFVGAAGVEDILDAPDDDIIEGVSRQLAALLPLPDRPESSAVVRWPSAMPQYEVGHLERLDRIEAALPPGVFLAGQSYRGAGIADAVRQATLAASSAGAFVSGAARDIEGERVP